MSIRSELLNIQHADPNNILHAADVVEWAKDNPDSALHRAIEWDDARAAHEYRLSQVRTLIQVHVVSEEGRPLLVSLTVDRVKGGGYRSIDDVLPVRDLREIMISDALARLEQVRQQYQHVAELARVWQETEAAREAQQKKAPGRQRRGARQTAAA